MKTIKQIIASIAFATTAIAQPYTIDTTTPHLYTNGTYVTTYYGDSVAAAFAKVNSNSAYFSSLNSILLAQLNSMSNSFQSVSNTLYETTNSQAFLTLQVGTNANNIIANAITSSNQFDLVGLNLTNYVNLAKTDLTNVVAATGLDLTNMVLSTGLDLSNRLDLIYVPGTSGSEFVLKFVSPDGTTWYQHVDNSGVEAVTGSP